MGFWDKERRCFVPKQNAEGTLKEYSDAEIRKILMSGKLGVDKKGLPKAIKPTAEEFEQQKATQYKSRIIELIRQRYSQDDEFAILRQRDEKTEEFNIYNEFCKECKAQAKSEVYGESVNE